ncbi:MAG: CotH kinase family protein, partial [Bacteroidales bacterium]|nr:CotH kinase family protein [Bacteroidales bacterium]
MDKPIILLVILLGATLLSCEKVVPINAGGGLDDWTEDSHSYLAEPDYSIVFNQKEAQRLDIVINKEYWKAMQDDLENLFVQKAVSNQAPPFPRQNPVYVPCQLFYKGKQWYDVGIRYKGNSSLSFPYRRGIGKLPFRLEFDHFENENPSISGQTFYGFSQLSFVNGFNDISLLHEKVATDVYRDFGVPAAHSAFYRIYIDHGEGAVYFGLYTMLEVVFDGPMLLNQFGSETGNCYKPEGPGAHFNDLFLINSTFFVNKTNPSAGLSDVRLMIRALLSEERILNPNRWREELESVFNVDQFLKWLAANTCMQNWDTYGRMSHNLYLYNNPANGLLTWIPWDNNATFREGAGDPGRSALNFDFSNL